MLFVSKYPQKGRTLFEKVGVRISGQDYWRCLVRLPGLYASDFSPLENALVLVDIEGAEFKLLSEEVLILLSKSTVIVEIQLVDEFITQYVAMIMRISELFDIDVIEREHRNTFVFEELRDFTDDNRALLASESRPCVMRFLRLTPKDDES